MKKKLHTYEIVIEKNNNKAIKNPPPWVWIVLIPILLISIIFVVWSLISAKGTSELSFNITNKPHLEKTILRDSSITTHNNSGLITSTESQNNHNRPNVINIETRLFASSKKKKERSLVENSIVLCQLPKKSYPKKEGSQHHTSFNDWLNQFKREASSLHVPDSIIEKSLNDVHIIKKVIELDHRQSEYSYTFLNYLRNSISNKRIRTGRKMLELHREILTDIESEYGVQPQYLVAFWAMESNFGNNMGNFSTISTIATLAHEGRRNEFFRGELFCTLQLINEQHIPPEIMKSSWAGAMGQIQFMPSTLYYYGADGDNDGKIDIWNNIADTFSSSANYLNQIGWKKNQSWGMEILLPKKFDPYIAKFSEEKTIREWKLLGIKQANGKNLLVNESIKGSIILPSGIKGPAFIVFHNFRVIREWNRSTNYALSVSHLADRLIGKGSLIVKEMKNERVLSRKQAISLQTNLKKLGFYTGKVDGMLGLMSRDAIREYQKTKNMIADAYPTIKLVADTKEDLINMK